ncbi:MAG: 3-phosphoshikimate 1-carboxyvinyltransferase, partial [bacterium]
MNLLVAPGGPLRGEIRVGADKSISHRAVLLGAIAGGRSRVRNLLLGDDVRATIAALRQMGVSIEPLGDAEFAIEGVGLRGLSQPRAPLDLGNSGTALRLLAGLLCGQRWQSVVTGDASLRARPMARIIEPLTRMGATIAADDARPPLRIGPSGALRGIAYRMPIASAQVKSCLLLAGLYAEGSTSVSAPAPSRDHTERMLELFGDCVVRANGALGGGDGGVARTDG